MEAVIRETAALMWNWHAWLAIVVLSIWGASGGLITYSIGKQGMPAIQSKFHQLNPAKLEYIGALYDRWGSQLLLISMVPVMGTMIRLGAGIYGVGLATFMLWSLIALLLRNWVLFLVAHGILQAL